MKICSDSDLHKYLNKNTGVLNTQKIDQSEWKQARYQKKPQSNPGIGKCVFLSLTLRFIDSLINDESWLVEWSNVMDDFKVSTEHSSREKPLVWKVLISFSLCTRVYIVSRLYSLLQPGSGHA